MTACVNYYPAETRGIRMWTPGTFDPVQIRKDFKLASQTLAFDTVRIFLPITAYNAADVDSAFTISSTGPTTSQLARLTQVFQIAVDLGVKLWLTLFDGFGQYGDRSQSTTMIQAFATAVPAGVPLSSLFVCIELQNEIKFSSTATYTGGGTAAITGGVGVNAVAWANAVIPVLHTSFPGVPLTASCTNDPTTDLAAGVAGVTGLDFWSWHAYDPHATQTDFNNAVSLAGSTLRLGEFGFPSKSGIQAQISWFDQIGSYWKAANPGGEQPAPWMLLDADPSSPYNTGLDAWAVTYGICDIYGAPKPVAARYARPTGGTMAQTGLMTDVAKNAVAAAYASAGPYLTLLRGLTLQSATAAGATTFSVDLSVAAGDLVVFDQGLATQEIAVVQAVTGAGPYTVTPATPLSFPHVLTGPNQGVQSHIPTTSATVHETASVTRVAANWGTPAPAGVITAAAGQIAVPSGSKIGSLAVFSASTAGTYFDATAIPGQVFAAAGSHQPTWVETFT